MFLLVTQSRCYPQCVYKGLQYSIHNPCSSLGAHSDRQSAENLERMWARKFALWSETESVVWLEQLWAMEVLAVHPIRRTVGHPIFPGRNTTLLQQLVPALSGRSSLLHFFPEGYRRPIVFRSIRKLSRTHAIPCGKANKYMGKKQQSIVKECTVVHLPSY